MGGNIFDNTTSIKKERIEPTLSKFTVALQEIFPNVNFNFVILGSAGKKDISGDIDLGFDENELFSESGDVLLEKWNFDIKHFTDIFNRIRKRARTATYKNSIIRAAIECMSEQMIDNNLLVSISGSGSGSLFCRFPQYDENGITEDYVQIDINIGNIEWLLFSYYSAIYNGNIKGLHRTQLIISLFVVKNRIFRHGSGVFNKELNDYEATTPAQVIDLLSELYNCKFTLDIINDYFKLHDFLKYHLCKSLLNNIYDVYLKILDSTQTDIPKELQEYWIENQDRLLLLGKFLPTTSLLYERINGRK